MSFDGASKGNQGLAGGGGLIESPNVDIIIRYALGLGTETNNIAEAMALWQGIQQAKEQGIQELTIIGDSRLIIKAINCQTQTQSAKLNNLLRKIRLLLANFNFYEVFHVLRKLNAKANVEANKGVLLEPGTLILNGMMSNVDIP
jgi:ribonuclease HI